MSDIKVETAILMGLEPLSTLSKTRLKELADLCFVEKVNKDLNPFRIRPLSDQSVYLIKGELALYYGDNEVAVIAAGSDSARFPLGKWLSELREAKALTDIELIRVDDDLLDIMVTWDQLASYEAGEQRARGETISTGEISAWMLNSGMFSAANIKYGAFSQLPTTNVEQLLRRITRVDVKQGEKVIQEGGDGDYYYLIEKGKAVVSRLVGGVTVQLAELKDGDAFGEEALVSEGKRNAAVTMKSDGVLLRLAKEDFVQLLREPLLHKLGPAEAQQRVVNGAVWLDVRYPSEYQYDRLPGAINIPLGEIRNAIGVLDKTQEYIAYCQSGRRSSTGAFILAQMGYNIAMLDGGLWALERFGRKQ